MNAMIFAAGLGTRLRPLTNDRPKALVEVAGKPLLQHQIEKMINVGFDHIAVNVHHFGQQIIDFLTRHDNFGIDIKISDERELLLDTGGGIKSAMQLFDNDEPVLIHNVDIISDIDIRALYEQHLRMHAECGNLATLAINKRETSRYLLFDNDLLMRGWTNIKTEEVKPEVLKYNYITINMYAFSGIHVVSKEILPYLEQRDDMVFPIMDFYINLCQVEKICGVDVTGKQWVDCGKPEHLEKASEIICAS